MNRCRIRITSEGEPSFEYVGFWEKDGECYKLNYYHEEEGVKSEYELMLSKCELKIRRSGDTEMAILIRPDRKTRCVIRLPQGKLMGDIETSLFELSEEDDYLRIHVIYDMIFGGDKNCRKLFMEVKKI